MKKNNEIITNDIDKFPEFENIRNAILEAREKVATTVNFAMVSAYWTIGKQLHEAMSGDGSIYGKQLIKYVSVRLSEEFGQGFDERNLRNMRQFYEVYPKWNTVCSELSWSHYRLLMRIKEQEKREYYQNECVECGWSVRQLERQINSFYYERILATSEGKKAEVRGEIQSLEPNTEPKHLLKDPYILEFLGLEENKTYLEHELEQGLIDNLQNFLLELGKGFCFVARQKRITIDGDHYYIDLVFYNYILNENSTDVITLEQQSQADVDDFFDEDEWTECENFDEKLVSEYVIELYQEKTHTRVQPDKENTYEKVMEYTTYKDSDIVKVVISKDAIKSGGVSEEDLTFYYKGSEQFFSALNNVLK